MRDYYEIYCTVTYNKDNKAEEHMTVNAWGNSEEDALRRAEEMVRGIICMPDDMAKVSCQVSGMFPHTLVEFVYEALRKNLTGRKKKKQGVITLKDMNLYLQDIYGIKNSWIKEVTADFIMKKDASGAITYFKDFLGISAEMFMGKFGLTEEQILNYEKAGKLEFAYEEIYGTKRIRYYKPDAYFQESI